MKDGLYVFMPFDLMARVNTFPRRDLLEVLDSESYNPSIHKNDLLECASSMKAFFFQKSKRLVCTISVPILSYNSVLEIMCSSEQNSLHQLGL